MRAGSRPSGGGQILNGMQPQVPGLGLRPLALAVEPHRQPSQNNELTGKNAALGEVWAVRANWFFEPGWEERDDSLPREQDSGT